ncbi:MAG: poly-beta-1,6-N-acetyl-D-glucosamine biosynthesis protein PgaD [Verrucomicrobia bacterium]|nr:poly-beta-1,6-N-acetyl-D-glucosamine biosynthesis protein PgaD [Verrucomicrobiota bacterium]
MKEPEIIDFPKLTTNVRWGAETTITLAAWTLWLYLLLPLVTMLLWAAGFRMVFVQQFMLSSAEVLATVSGWYLLGVLAIGLVLEGFSIYNRRKFGELDRRKVPTPVADGELAAAYGVDVDTVIKARNARILVVRFKAGGLVLDASDQV